MLNTPILLHDLFVNFDFFKPWQTEHETCYHHHIRYHHLQVMVKAGQYSPVCITSKIISVRTVHWSKLFFSNYNNL